MCISNAILMLLIHLHLTHQNVPFYELFDVQKAFRVDFISLLKTFLLETGGRILPRINKAEPQKWGAGQGSRCQRARVPSHPFLTPDAFSRFSSPRAPLPGLSAPSGVSSKNVLPRAQTFAPPSPTPRLSVCLSPATAHLQRRPRESRPVFL